MDVHVHNVAIELAGHRIVHEVSLQVASGEIVGLVGPNGSGKSTLLRTIYRMLRPSAGRVLLQSDDLWKKLSARESARRTGVVVQESQAEFELTVREVVEMGRTPHKGLLERDTNEDAIIVEEALQKVEMYSAAERLMSTLSGGEKQRVLIARALAQRPQFLVLDEPTNHLDIQHQLEMLELVRGIGITTLVTLHDLNLAASYCQKLYVINAGYLVAAGTPEEVLTPQSLQPVFQVGVTVGRHPRSGHLHLFFSPQASLPEQEQILTFSDGE